MYNKKENLKSTQNLCIYENKIRYKKIFHNNKDISKNEKNTCFQYLLFIYILMIIKG